MRWFSKPAETETPQAEPFSPDPGRLRTLMQLAMGDRVIQSVPGYDPEQVLPVVVINASEFPTGGGAGPHWSGWQSMGGSTTNLLFPTKPTNGEIYEVWPVVDLQGGTLQHPWRYELWMTNANGVKQTQLPPAPERGVSDGYSVAGSSIPWVASGITNDPQVRMFANESNIRFRGGYVRQWVDP